MNKVYGKWKPSRQNRTLVNQNQNGSHSTFQMEIHEINRTKPSQGIQPVVQKSVFHDDLHSWHYLLVIS